MENSFLEKLNDFDAYCLTKFEEENKDLNDLFGGTNNLILSEIEKYFENSNHLLKINNREEFLKLLQSSISATTYNINSIKYYPFFITKSLKLRIGQVKLNCYSPDISTLKHNYTNSTSVFLFFNRNKSHLEIAIDEHITYRNNLINFDALNSEDTDVYNSVKKIYSKVIETLLLELHIKKEHSLNCFLAELDKNSDSKIDLFENDFLKILEKNQEVIISKNREYVHQFIKINSYLDSKKKNIELQFNEINEIKPYYEIDERLSSIKDEIYSYELILFNSLNMLIALLDNNMIVFYSIYEIFDKLNIFNSNIEKEISSKLSNIEIKLDNLIESMKDLEKSLINELKSLSYTNQQSFEELKSSVSKHLTEINSSISFSNLLNGIQTYQLYKINKNTKNNIN